MDIVEGLRHRARVLHRRASAQDPSALARVRQLKALRELDAEAIQKLTASANHYAENAARFRRDLKPL